MTPNLHDHGSVAHWRMRTLRLAGHPFDTPESVVGWLGAVQAQDYAPAKWSIGQRALGVTDAAVERAFAAGTVLRTHVMRPTWHFVLPADIRWMLELTAPRVQALNAYQFRQVGLDEALREKCDSVLADALRGGNHLTRKELAAVLERAGIATGPRLGHILMNAELNGVVCSGPMSGKQNTYALLEERVPPACRRSREEALAELTLRYFTGHGPATVKDFKWWSSLTTSDIRAGLDLVGARLHREVVDGVEYWFAEPAPPSTPDSPTVHLLQTYDEYVVGYSESRLVPLSTGPNAAFTSAVVLDGRAVGRWTRTARKATVLIEVALDAPLDDAETGALHAAADRYGDFLGAPATVTGVAERTAPRAAGRGSRRSGDGGPPRRGTPQPPRKR